MLVFKPQDSRAGKEYRLFHSSPGAHVPNENEGIAFAAEAQHVHIQMLSTERKALDGAHDKQLIL